MLRFAVFVVLFATVCAVPKIDKWKPTAFDMIFVNSYIARNLNVELFEEMEKEEVQDGQQIKYTFGKRVDGMCDNILRNIFLSVSYTVC